jgi:hypothetical protein
VASSSQRVGRASGGQQGDAACPELVEPIAHHRRPAFPQGIAAVSERRPLSRLLVARPPTASRGSHSGSAGATLSKKIWCKVVALKGVPIALWHAPTRMTVASVMPAAVVSFPGRAPAFFEPTCLGPARLNPHSPSRRTSHRDARRCARRDPEPAGPSAASTVLGICGAAADERGARRQARGDRRGVLAADARAQG